MGLWDDLSKLAEHLAAEAQKTTTQTTPTLPVVAPDIEQGSLDAINNPQTLPMPQKHSYQGAPGRYHDNETVISDGPTNYYDTERNVQLACRFVGGAVSGTLAQRLIDAVTGPGMAVPNPTYHWCIVVGGYLHQLQAAENKWNYYTSEVMNVAEGWYFFPIGTTRWNDVAIRDESTKVMNSMPEQYDVFNNNCQVFSLRLVDRILAKARTTKYRMANMTYGRQVAPKIDIKMMEPVITRIDDEEVVDSADVEPVEAPGQIEGVINPHVEPVVLEDMSAHGEAVEIVASEVDGQELEEISRAEVLRNMAAVMVRNTPTLTLEDIQGAKEGEYLLFQEALLVATV